MNEELRKELAELLRDRQTAVTAAISISLPTLISLLFDAQSNPGIQLIFGVAIFLLFLASNSIYVLLAKKKAGIIVRERYGKELVTKRYPLLQPYAIGSLFFSIFIGTTLVFLPSVKQNLSYMVWGTSTPASTLTSTPSSTATLTPSPKPMSDSFLYYMIIYDSSIKMKESFHGQEKAQVARNLLIEIMNGLPPRAQYSLITIGGSNTPDTSNPCNSPVSPAIPFSSRENAYTYLTSLQPQGGGSFYQAFRLAKNELENLPTHTIRTLIYITGSNDTCETEDEWTALKNLMSFPDSTFGIYSQVIILDDDEIRAETLADQFNSLSNDNIDVEAPRSIQEVQNGGVTVVRAVNNVTSYVNQSLATGATTTATTTSTPSATLRPGETYIPSPTWTATLTPSLPAFVCPPFAHPGLNSGLGGSVSIDTLGDCSIGHPLESPIYTSGSFSDLPPDTVIWEFVYAPDGLYYPQSPNACGDSRPPDINGNTWQVNTYMGSASDPFPEWYEIVAVVADQPASAALSQWFLDNCPFFPGIPPASLQQLNITEKSSVRVQTMGSFITAAQATSTVTLIPANSVTPNPTLALLSMFSEIDKQLKEALKANIAYVAPESMKLDDSFTIELSLNPSLSQEALAATVAVRDDFITTTPKPGILITDAVGNLRTNTPESGQLVTNNGISAGIVTSEVEITNRMKAVLTSNDPDAFTVQPMDIDAEQVISSTETTTWHWSITAKKEGTKTLELVLYRLVKLDNQEYWRAVETYKANINVVITPVQRLRNFDWKWLLGLLLIPAFWRWFDAKRKRAASEEERKPKEKPKPRRKKKVVKKENTAKNKTKRQQKR